MQNTADYPTKPIIDSLLRFSAYRKGFLLPERLALSRAAATVHFLYMTVMTKRKNGQ